MLHIVMGSDLVGQPLLSHLMTALPFDLRRRVVRQQEDYASVAREVANLVHNGAASRGVLVCGTGIGMAIAANRMPGMRAAVCHDLYSTRRSILSNDCQIACFGSRVIAGPNASALLEVWLNLTYDCESGSQEKLRSLDAPGT